jgi:MFS family permease
VKPVVAPDAVRLLAARALRGFADGVLSLVVPLHLVRLGAGTADVGTFVAAALLGSALLTLAVGLVAHRIRTRTVFLPACALMLATAVGLSVAESMPVLLAIAFFGTLNPGGGDVSVFLPMEQSLLAKLAGPAQRTATFAYYNLAGALGSALGALASGVLDSGEAAFAVYGGIALGLALLYLPLGAFADHTPVSRPRAPLVRSRRTVLQLSALFSLDSFGGGFAVDSLLVLWLDLRFGLSAEATAEVFFAARLLAAASQLAAVPLARRTGLVRTMVFTHLPANLFLIGAALAPVAPLAITLLLLRAALSQMDVPARQALVMALVPPDEQAAAASVTNVPRSLATALAPIPAGALLGISGIGWPLIAGGALKIAYDLWFFALFRRREP